MAFVYKEISPEEKHKVAHLKYPFDHRQDALIRCWTRDKDRDAALVFLGGGGSEVPQYFMFMWQGEEIELVGTENVKYLLKSEGGTQVYRNLLPYEMPSSLQDRKDELQNLIREAFIATGYAGRTEGKTVHVEFIQYNKRNTVGE